MPEGVGYFGDDQHDKIVRQIDEQERYLLEQLTPRFQNVVRWMRLFLADRDDPRGPDEKWRANVFVPYPYSGVETRVAVLSDIFNSADPLIQAEAVGDEDLEGANKIERLLNYQLRRIKWRKRILNGLRMMAIQGTEFFKVRWVTKAHQITVYSDPSQIEDFTKAMLDAMVATGVQNREDVPDPTGDPEGFEVWRQMVNSSGQKVPEPPYSGKRWIKRYAGPSVDRVPLFDLRFDPLVDELEEQPIVIHRMVKPLRWLLSQTGDRPDQPYDPVAVARTMEATKATNTQRLSDQDQRIAEIMGITPLQAADPFYRDAVEILECYMPGGEWPFVVVLNRTGIINKRPSEMPYQHGMVPLVQIRNVQLSGFSLGISELQEPESLYYELNSIRSLRLDAVTLAALPVFQKLRELGLPEHVRKLRPGDIIPVHRTDAIKRLMEGQVPAEVFREPPEIKADIDETNATTGNMRGGPSTIGRVSATENQQRFNQALARMKSSAVQVEEDLDPAVEQSLGLWYQYGPPEVKLRVQGGPDAWVSITKEDIFESLEQDYAFRGATRAANRELQVQQMTTFGEKFMEKLYPWEVRSLMKLIWRTGGVPGASLVVSGKGDQLAMQDFQAAQAAQAMQQQLAAKQAAMGAVTPPATVSGDVAAALDPSNQGGGGGGGGQGGQGSPPAPTGGV